MRGRFGSPQLPGQPPLFLPSFRCVAGSNGGPAGMPQPLNLSESDIEPTPEEVEQIHEMLARAKVKRPAHPVVQTNGPEAAIVTPDRDEDAGEGDRPPAAVIEPATAITGLRPGGALQTEAIQNPGNYGPVTYYANGKAEKPVLSNPPPATNGKLVTDTSLRAIKANRLKAINEQEAARTGAAESDASRLADSTQAIDELEQKYGIAPSTNGHNTTSNTGDGKKGGQ
jgi:hypothetical protein